MAGDTDSFFLQTHNVDLNQLKKAMKEECLLDTSNYPVNHELYDTNIASVIGKFKDESKGVGYKEWVFLRPKCYSLLKDDSKETNKSKWVNLIGSGVNHSDYKDIYLNGGSLEIDQKQILSINHQLLPIKNSKNAIKC